MSKKNEKNYVDTLNLPKTSFPMRGNLPEREPYFLSKFEKFKVYEKLLERNRETGKSFILHDGPPYANGNIHMGHAVNKILKDIIIRYKSMNGYYSPYVPGFDTHGLPIEKKVQTEKKLYASEVGVSSFRDACKNYAVNAVRNQTKGFKRLGGLGNYDSNYYLTLDHSVETRQLELFWDMYKEGYIYRDLKPVYWCSDCNTALAEAEIEYKDHETNSIYVKFRVIDDKGVLKKFGDLKNVHLVIWTTTPWTLPGNQAITVNPDFEYSLIKHIDTYYIVAKDLAKSLMEKWNLSNATILDEENPELVIKGSDLEGVEYEKTIKTGDQGRVILGSHNDLNVTLDAGTGLVHTAPGHGHEDYKACKRYKDIRIVVPVDDKGVMNEEAWIFKGLHYTEANTKIVEYLKQFGMLLAEEKMNHQYPHCWRCKNPVIYRATTQWFASVDKFRDKVLDEVKNVKWHPSWGEERMTNMVKDRADWCISRQRTWGVPIPIFYCNDCGKELINEQTMARIMNIVAEKGTNAWFDLSEEEMLKGLGTCSCGCDKFTKETDIMDVWFDSGSTHKSVLENPKYDINEEIADMYLEGTDQYRGWFQSSLLTSVATKGKAPYKEVVTHGFVVDSQGRKMSKSLGNGIDPLDVINKYGADILRLWVTSSDYTTDIRISDDILSQVSEVYKKIRNTFRFLLGNLSDFNINIASIPYSERDEIDKYMLYKLNKLIEYINTAYDNYDFHLVYSELHRFCTVELSSKYLDVVKDRLYTFRKDHPLRISTQSTMNDILRVLVKLVSPILTLTSEEVWSFMTHNIKDNTMSPILNNFPTEKAEYYDDKELIEKWDKIYEIKEYLAKYLEEARVAKTIGNSLDAYVKLRDSKEEIEFVRQNEKNIKLVSIISEFEYEIGEKSVEVKKAYGLKCARCWTYSATVGNFKEDRNICEKCVNNM